MDFQQIDHNVMKYLDKQKKSLQLNPRGINLTIKKLDQYANNFHFEINELLKQENKSINNDIEKKIQKPKIKFVDVDRFDDADKVKSKLVSVSNKLINELNILIKNSRGFHVDTGHGSTKRFRRNVDYILREELDVAYENTSRLNRVVSAINQEIRYGYCEDYDNLNKLFQLIRDYRVIDELKGSSEENLFVIIDDMFKQYKDYFSQCIVSYLTYYKHMPEMVKKDEEQEIIKANSELKDESTSQRMGSQESKNSKQVASVITGSHSKKVTPSNQSTNNQRAQASPSFEVGEGEVLASKSNSSKEVTPSIPTKSSEEVAVNTVSVPTELEPLHTLNQQSQLSKTAPTKISQQKINDLAKSNQLAEPSVKEGIKTEQTKDKSTASAQKESETVIAENEKAYLESQSTKPNQKSIETISIRYNNGETRELSFNQIDQKLNLQLEGLFVEIEQLTKKINKMD
ncbi:hypothetical protein BKP37_09080 [Anaerobacillus alkalilacustris]|uniref:Uncharacterized protein n=1 Tax=Anaerobacillus alkalilacustris TaxID=393763 RepID=A0A1S2LS66_9BACI|nr:hypothetical protein [Anaerobacillus alkalilacustris]OIJ14225.1 hypothetical protein BKP37_09080 [Anaerobacillus alkalilacustris]